MPYGVATYWKCDELRCIFDIGPFGRKAQADEFASRIVSLTTISGKAVVRTTQPLDYEVDGTHVIFYKVFPDGKVEYDFDLPGGLDWLVEHGYGFVEAGSPVTIPVSCLDDNAISDAASRSKYSNCKIGLVD